MGKTLHGQRFIAQFPLLPRFYRFNSPGLTVPAAVPAEKINGWPFFDWSG